MKTNKLVLLYISISLLFSCASNNTTDKKYEPEPEFKNSEYPIIKWVLISSQNKGYLITLDENEKYFFIWPEGPVFNYNTEEEVSPHKYLELSDMIQDFKNKSKIKEIKKLYND